MSESADVSVIVTPAGQQAGVDELAQVLAARFGAPALRLRIELQRGGAEVARLPRDHADHVAEELRALGFDVHVGRDAGSVRRIANAEPAPVEPAPVEPAAPTRDTLNSDPEGSSDTRYAPGPAAARGRTEVARPRAEPVNTMLGRPSKTDSFERRIDEMWGPAARGDASAPAPVVKPAGRGDGVPVQRTDAAVPVEPADAGLPQSGPRAQTPAWDPNATQLDPAWERVEEALAAAGVSPGTSSVPGDAIAALQPAPPAPSPERSLMVDAPDRGGPIRAGSAPIPPPVEAGTKPSDPPVRRGWSAVLGEDIPTPGPATPRPEPGGAAADDYDETATVMMPHAPHATPRPRDRGHDALDALAARPPMDADARYERLKAGVERDERSPSLAGMWSVLGPGAGQAYNGQRSRALTFALAGVLIVPWIVSVVDAVRVARALRDGKRRGKPQATQMSIGIVAGWWIFVVAAALGLQALDRVTTRPSIVVESPTVDSPAGSGVADDREDPNPVPEVDRGPAEHRAEIRRQVDALVLEARAACAAGRCEECVRIAEDALELDESSRAAQQLHVEAVTALGSGGSCRDVGQRAGD